MILTALCGHGMLDMAAYDKYFEGGSTTTTRRQVAEALPLPVVGLSPAASLTLRQIAGERARCPTGGNT